MTSVIMSLFSSLLLIGLPIAFTLAIVGTIGLYLFSGGLTGLSQVPIIAYKALDSFSLISLPMYILMGQILLKSGIGKDLYEMASRWLRHLPGGLAIATLLCCSIFAAISGSSVATAITIGVIAIPEMTSRGYNKRDVLGLLAAGGTLGILIPPSVPMIIYGTITGESIGKLFMAGIIPGILLAFCFMIFASWKLRHIKQEPATWHERIQGSHKAIWGFIIPIIVIGGIYTGVFTPTEAAATGVVLSTIIAGFVYRTLNFESIKKIMISTMSTSTMVLFIMMGALLFGHILTDLRIPQEITNNIVSLDVSPWVIFILINLVLLVLGCFLEVISIIVITVPILYPLLTGLGFDPIWFAIVMVVNMELAIVTPPLGMNLFALKSISNDSQISDIAIGVIPYIIIMILFIGILAIFPEIALWLPTHVK